MRNVSHRNTADDVGGKVMNLPAFGAFKGGRNARVRSFAMSLFCVLVYSNVLAQTAPGTLIRNTGVIEFVRPSGGTDTSFTNTVNTTVEPLPTASRIALLRATTSTSSTLQST